jgi:hypothetical protein
MKELACGVWTRQDPAVGICDPGKELDDFVNNAEFPG